MLTMAAALGMNAWAVSADTPLNSSLNFDSVFSDLHEPASIHFQAAYFVGPDEHRLELWRLGETRLRRRTDDVLETYLVRKPNDVDYQMIVLDRNRKISTRIDRTHLYQIGNFTDWFDLAHGLKHPQGSYQLAKIAAPAGSTKPVAYCDWYSLLVSGRESRICWSRKYRLPLLIYTGPQSQLVWQMQSLSTEPVNIAEFAFDDTGFVENDANQDIERD